MTGFFARNRVLLQLIAAQTCFYLIVSVDLTLTALAGLSLAPAPVLATLPLSLIVVAGTGCAFAAGHAVARFGYRSVLMAGACCAVAGGLLSAAAVAWHSFELFCLGTAITGGYRAVGGFIRFIASENVPPERRERAMALVLYGGIAAAAVGPFAAVAASAMSAQPFVGSCVLVAAVGCVAWWLARSTPSANGSAAADAMTAVRVVERRRDPVFLQSLVVLAASGAVMTLVMAAGPLANQHEGHGTGMGAAMIQWHLVGMFAPAALSAWLLKRWGAGSATVVGAAVMAAGCGLGLASSGAMAMVATLALVGVGWNILFVTGSALLIRSYPRGRGSRLQGFADGSTAAVSALASVASAGLLVAVGWGQLNAIAVVVLAAMLAGYGLLASVRRKDRHPEQEPAVLVKEETPTA